MNSDTATLDGGRSALLASPTKVGMLAFLLSEVAFFSTLISTYVVFLRETKASEPGPAEVFADDMPLVLAATICLLASSVTVALAVRVLRRGRLTWFAVWLLLTILLGAEFLAGTAVEWYGLIVRDGLTIGTNLFGTTFYSLVGFHAGHVTLGLLLLILVWIFTVFGAVRGEHAERVELLSWYWHFVDVVWLVVLTAVYIVGR